MDEEKMTTQERIQRLVVRLVATHPAGRGLLLIGGFRYRLLDNSARRSLDVDFHCATDLGEKQVQLLQLLKRKLLPEVRRRWGYEGTAEPAHGPDVDSPAVKTIDLAFWRQTVPGSRMELPVEITRTVCLDRSVVRTADGVVYATVTDADMIEAKILALFNRALVTHRDLIDIFLFGNHLRPDSPQRLKEKLRLLSLPSDHVRKRMEDFRQHRDYHGRSLDQVVHEQLEAETADCIRGAGGGRMILDRILNILTDPLEIGGEQTP